MREQLKLLIPRPLLETYREVRRKALQRELAGKSPSEVFATVYSRRLWGDSGDQEHPFCSGSGSTEPRVVDAYVDAVWKWLAGFPAPPSVGDLGCGDFRVGARLRGGCGTYTAYDCVPALLDSNRRRWLQLDVQFKQLDLCAAPPAAADVFFVRQVLQHLSNGQISHFLGHVRDRCTWLVVTEHVSQAPFTPNIDKPAGPDTRLHLGSGVDLTAPPFSLQTEERYLLCEVRAGPGAITTHVYRLR